MTSPLGTVTLVGGGPGDPELLTVAAVRALGNADVVLYDRLAPHDTLTDLAPNAVLVHVGKQPGHHPIPQDEIERMVIAHARAGANVVRLKGGDSFVFGRGGEEMLACRRAGIPVRIIPGVTSAVSVPAAASIPVTHREIARMFTVVSGHAPLSSAELSHLVGLDSTIVVLMGLTNLSSITAGLTRHGMDPQTPVAIIERGYSAQQRTTFGSLHTITTEAARVGVESPAVIVIGAVVGLARAGDADATAMLTDTVAVAGR